MWSQDTHACRSKKALTGWTKSIIDHRINPAIRLESTGESLNESTWTWSRAHSKCLNLWSSQGESSNFDCGRENLDSASLSLPSQSWKREWLSRRERWAAWNKGRSLKQTKLWSDANWAITSLNHKYTLATVDTPLLELYSDSIACLIATPWSFQFAIIQVNIKIICSP